MLLTPSIICAGLVFGACDSLPAQEGALETQDSVGQIQPEAKKTGPGPELKRMLPMEQWADLDKPASALAAQPPAGGPVTPATPAAPVAPAAPRRRRRWFGCWRWTSPRSPSKRPLPRTATARGTRTLSIGTVARAAG